jgi:release factor glutamine methyltransferase
MRLQVLLVQARQQLADMLALPGNEAAIEVQTLLRCALGDVSRAWMIAHDLHELSPEQQSSFDNLLQRRLRGEPVAYILGRREFYGLDFAVGPGVLIPRPDTETLVEAALQRIPLDRPCRVLDLGAGSGAVAIALALQRPAAAVKAVEHSEIALAAARRNAETLEAGNLRLVQSDWFSALGGQTFDVIVSNPPYIPAADPHLQQGDLSFEPHCALESGEDGLDDIRAIVAQAPAYLDTGGWLLLEHGYDQAQRVEGLLEGAGFGDVGHVADLAGIVRVTLGRKS